MQKIFALRIFLITSFLIFLILIFFKHNNKEQLIKQETKEIQETEEIEKKK